MTELDMIIGWMLFVGSSVLLIVLIVDLIKNP